MRNLTYGFNNTKSRAYSGLKPISKTDRDATCASKGSGMGGEVRRTKVMVLSHSARGGGNSYLHFVLVGGVEVGKEAHGPALFETVCLDS